jgi:tRNA threonylcarbamoyladenosine biosynthesis protein TsaB
MLGLAVDTSTKYLCVVLVENGQVIAKYNRIKERLHGQLLIPVIEKIFKDQNRDLAELDFLAVDIGPGSFTGLRIGISAIKGLGFALNIPVIGISSLDLIASNCRENKKTGLICSLIDAKRKQVYAALFKRSSNKLQRQGKYFLGSIDDLLSKIKGPVLFCGDAIDLYRQQIIDRLGDNADFAGQKLWYTDPRAFAGLCFESFKNKKYKKAEDIVPMYLYSNTCTVRKKTKKQ